MHMQTVEETLKLLKRQLELETAIRQGRLSDRRRPRALRVTATLGRNPEAIRAVLQASHALRRPVSDIGPHDVESWTRTSIG
jgi:hypothetical protein